jgi:hypothetical protein
MRACREDGGYLFRSCIACVCVMMDGSPRYPPTLHACLHRTRTHAECTVHLSACPPAIITSTRIVTLLDGYIGSPGVETFCMFMALLMPLLVRPIPPCPPCLPHL